MIAFRLAGLLVQVGSCHVCMQEGSRRRQAQMQLRRHADGDLTAFQREAEPVDNPPTRVALRTLLCPIVNSAATSSSRCRPLGNDEDRGRGVCDDRRGDTAL